MGIYGKIILIFTALASLFLFNPMIVCAQPLGILSQKPGQKPQQKILSSSSGRFIFGQISDSGKDKFMLDTFTGRLWRIAESGDDKADGKSQGAKCVQKDCDLAGAVLAGFS